MDDISAVTRIFQYTIEKRLLQEFDLVGILKHQSSFSKDFDEKQILAVNKQKAKFLLTPEANNFLKTLDIMEIR